MNYALRRAVACVLAACLGACSLPVGQSELDALLAELGPLVEQDQGHPLPEGLRIERVGVEEIAAWYAATYAGTEGVDLAAFVAREAATTPALYDHARRRILFCWSTFRHVMTHHGIGTARERLTLLLLHELAHAADANKPGGAWDDDPPDVWSDAAVARAAVFEGHAQQVMLRVGSRLGLAEEARFLARHVILGSFAYRQGLAFMEAVERARGREGVQRALRYPPRRSDRIRDPDLYLAEFAVPVPGG